MSPQRQSNSTSLKLKQSLLIGGFVLALVVIGGYFLTIQELEIRSNPESRDTLYAQLDFLLGQSLFFTNLEKTPLFTTTLVNDKGQIFVPIQIQKKFPGTLIITFQEQDPLYRLLWQDNFYLVNSQHYLTADVAAFGLPTVEVSTAYQDKIHPEKIDASLNQQIQNFLQSFQTQQLEFDKFYLNQEESYIIFKGLRFIFEDNADPAVLAAKLKLIQLNLDQLVANMGSIKAIDMRFDLPVVKTRDNQFETSESANLEKNEILDEFTATNSTAASEAEVN
jgi:hypothetical protein